MDEILKFRDFNCNVCFKKWFQKSVTTNSKCELCTNSQFDSKEKDYNLYEIKRSQLHMNDAHWEHIFKRSFALCYCGSKNQRNENVYYQSFPKTIRSYTHCLCECCYNKYNEFTCEKCFKFQRCSCEKYQNMIKSLLILRFVL